MKSPKRKKGKPSFFRGVSLMAMHNQACSYAKQTSLFCFSYLSENSLMRCSSSSLQMSSRSSFSATI